MHIPVETRKEMTLQERKKLNSKKWYANKEKYLEFINKNGKKPEEIKKRMTRELNNSSRDKCVGLSQQIR